MARRSLIATACAILALSVPAAALADSAGDNQYQDPFSNVPSQKKQNSSTGTTTQPSTPAPAPSGSTSPSSSAGTSTDPIAHAADGGTLPRTGFPLLPVAAIGAALVGAGLVLRRLTT
ncbi:MAG TPA: hypothetical protein VH817_06805 [Thermoleophilaceae bacterium]|jgi:hypothetical protein